MKPSEENFPCVHNKSQVTLPCEHNLRRFSPFLSRCFMISGHCPAAVSSFDYCKRWIYSRKRSCTPREEDPDGLRRKQRDRRARAEMSRGYAEYSLEETLRTGSWHLLVPDTSFFTCKENLLSLSKRRSLGQVAMKGFEKRKDSHRRGITVFSRETVKRPMLLSKLHVT